MGAGGVLLDLLPLDQVVLQLLVPRVPSLQVQRVVLELLRGQEHLDEGAVGLFFLEDGRLPLRLLKRQIPQDQLPTVLPEHFRLVRDAFRQALLQPPHIYHLLVQSIHQVQHLLPHHSRQLFIGKLKRKSAPSLARTPALALLPLGSPQIQQIALHGTLISRFKNYEPEDG